MEKVRIIIIDNLMKEVVQIICLCLCYIDLIVVSLQLDFRFGCKHSLNCNCNSVDDTDDVCRPLYMGDIKCIFFSVHCISII